ncbi:hypothetical protein [Pengzhenrongella phosphoraccumulans]|uniref:hypothetical protein n=1 Tax=Pengzhenrongella phosphoraccumulans TaxID=3114394 RepID=UPI00388E941C
MSTDGTVLELAEHTRERTRAGRHARSLPLVFVACGLLVLAWLRAAVSVAFVVEIFVPLAVFLVLYLVMVVRRLVTGLGTGTDGYGVVLVISALMAMMVPIAGFFLGALFFLGVGLAILGWRGQDRMLWIPGILLAATSPLVTYFVLDNHLRFLGPQPSVVVLVAAAVILIGLGVRAFIAERALTPPSPVAGDE